MIRFAAKGWIGALYVDPAYHFPYWGFAWLRPWPGPGMYLHFLALALAALCLALGLRHRLAALACLLLFTHVELLDKAAYLNHYYFVSVVLLLLLAMPLGRASAAFDLGVPFLLLHRRCRPYAFAALLGFHGLTGALFPIGMFPWIMSCAALIFFPPDWPRRLLRALGRPVPADISHVPTDSHAPLGRIALAALALHFGAQLLLPLRHHIYGGDHGWHEQGFRFAWHVMLVEKTGVVTYRVRRRPLRRACSLPAWPR